MIYNSPLFILRKKVTGKIMLVLFSVLIVLFPSNLDVIASYQEYHNTAERYSPAIMEVIKAKDIPELKALLCDNIKENTKKLDSQLKKFYKTIDGNITSISMVYSWVCYQERMDDKRVIHQDDTQYYITTDTGKEYSIHIVYENVNNFNQKEVNKIRRLYIMTVQVWETIYDLSATEGVRAWHE